MFLVLINSDSGSFMNAIAIVKFYYREILPASFLSEAVKEAAPSGDINTNRLLLNFFVLFLKFHEICSLKSSSRYMKQIKEDPN